MMLICCFIFISHFKLLLTRFKRQKTVGWLTACLLPSDSEAARKMRWLLGNGWVMEPTASPLGPWWQQEIKEVNTCYAQGSVFKVQVGVVLSQCLDCCTCHFNLCLFSFEVIYQFLYPRFTCSLCLFFQFFITYVQTGNLDCLVCHYANKLWEGTEAEWVKCLRPTWRGRWGK